MPPSELRLPLLADVPLDRPAILDDVCGEWLTYGELAIQARDWCERLSKPKGLVFLYASNDAATVCVFLGAIAAGHAVALFDPDLSDEARKALVETYRPEWIIGPENGNLTLVESDRDAEAALHPDLAVLLSTSGSTGSPKLVRLTLAALESNASAIAEVLFIDANDTAAGYLPLHYSYGLSVLTSHLSQGARVRLSRMGLTDRAFWPAMRDAGITHMPGVPFHFQIMQKLGYRRLNLQKLRVLTQAGGAMPLEARRQAHAFMEGASGGFYVLYGQTEAAPRMTTLQHGDFSEAPESVGRALPGCRIEILHPDSTGAGEVVFHGPNVMMGYAECRADLSKGDELSGQLRTGDIGFLDQSGRLTLTGRSKRFGKLYGLRINLDEVELLANASCEAAVTQAGEVLMIHIVGSGVAGADEAHKNAILAGLKQRFTIPMSSYRFEVVTQIPRTERGKVNYPALEVSA